MYLYATRFLVLLSFFAIPATLAINGGTPRLEVFNGWKAFEVITEGDDPTGSWEMPDDFDGAGAWISNPNQLRIVVNHENDDATISEVNVDLQKFKTSILNMIVNGTLETTDSNGTVSGVEFVQDAQQAYSRWSEDLGETWENTTSEDDTDFHRFCSGQAYEANTFGDNRGFVDRLYITGEEVEGGRLVALDLVKRELYVLSGAVGAAPNAGNDGMPFDAWENAALVDTGETKHVALILPPDGGTEDLQFYIGHKNVDKNCNEVSNPGLLERNGLACGSYYFMTGDLPADFNETLPGSFSIENDDAVSSSKLEDVDTFPSDPTLVVLAEENEGTFVLEFFLDFATGIFNPDTSSFMITNIVDQVSGSDDVLNDADNVDWTASTSLGGNDYPMGLIFVNEDDENGEVWHVRPDGSNRTLVARANAGSGTTGIFDASEFVEFKPASILVCNNKGDPSSMTVLINPDAELLFGDLPTLIPTDFPSPAPTITPVPTESAYPSSSPSVSAAPSSGPSESPSKSPTSSVEPSAMPSSLPSSNPSFSMDPSAKPSSPPSSFPTSSTAPSVMPTHSASSSPTFSAAPSAIPSSSPSSSLLPTITKTSSPSHSPTMTFSVTPTSSPSMRPSSAPTSTPSVQPTLAPVVFTLAPSLAPTDQPTPGPTFVPTASKSSQPTVSQSAEPTERVLSAELSQSPSTLASQNPSSSLLPSAVPSASTFPSSSFMPSNSQQPSLSPMPSWNPSSSASPSMAPSLSILPSTSPSQGPTLSSLPSMQPSLSVQPSLSQTPSTVPSSSSSPSSAPTVSASPSASPSQEPTLSTSPSQMPSVSQEPSSSSMPSVSPTLSPQPSLGRSSRDGASSTRPESEGTAPTSLTIEDSAPGSTNPDASATSWGTRKLPNFQVWGMLSALLVGATML